MGTVQTGAGHPEIGSVHVRVGGAHQIVAERFRKFKDLVGEGNVPVVVLSVSGIREDLHSSDLKLTRN